MADTGATFYGSGLRYTDASGATGWQKMAKTVRELDEDKIKGYRDDIDSLLVFAGLYSAVLSAFNIESYRALLPDPNDQVIRLLERIAIQTQSYTLTPGTANSTIDISAAKPAFTAPLWAARVNGLWFASLIISLAAASLSLLAKQWLREYLAMEHVSPQLRLRARELRRPQLDRWKVFEIAALLPLLLQFSLGLFFIGLCIFTGHLGAQMALTSIPLVLGWFFFIIITTLAPLFTPRCPYKAPLLKATMLNLRTNITMRLRSTCVSIVLSMANRVGYRASLNQSSRYQQEEDEAILDFQHDSYILLKMDRIMFDDSLLMEMWTAYTSTPHMEYTHGFTFLMELLTHRLRTSDVSIHSGRLRCILDLTALSHKTWNIFMEIFADMGRRGHPTGPLLDSDPDWIYNTALVLTSSSPYPLPAPAADYLSSLLADSSQVPHTMALAQWIHPRPEEEFIVFRPLAKRLLQLYGRSTDTKEYALPIIYMYTEILRNSREQSDDPKHTLYPLLVRKPNLFHDQRVIPVLRDMGEYLCGILRQCIETQIYGTEESFHVMVTYADHLGIWSEAASVLSATWAAKSWSFRALVHLTRLTQHYDEPRESRARMLELAVDAFAQSSDQASLIRNSTENARGLTNDLFQDFSGVIDVIRFCALHIQLYLRFTMDKRQTESSQKNSDSTAPIQRPSRKEWMKLWKSIGAALHTYWRLELWKTTKVDPWWHIIKCLEPEDLLKEDQYLAGECLRLIERAESYEDLAAHRSSSHRILFPDNIVSALGLFILTDDVAAYPRLKHLKEAVNDADSDPSSELLTGTDDRAMKTAADTAAGSDGINVDFTAGTDHIHTAHDKQPILLTSDDHAEDATSEDSTIDPSVEKIVRETVPIFERAVRTSVARARKGGSSSEVQRAPHADETVDATESDGEREDRVQKTTA